MTPYIFETLLQGIELIDSLKLMDWLVMFILH